jgi:toxin ParE1/3/4
MKRPHVHPAAEAEADLAFEWYWMRSESPALGFDGELRSTFKKLLYSPRIDVPYLRGTRRAMLNRYPYFVVFRELPRKIEILAVAHAKQRPGYWSKRL